jgi:hypothetical protein
LYAVDTGTLTSMDCSMFDTIDLLQGIVAPRATPQVPCQSPDRVVAVETGRRGTFGVEVTRTPLQPGPIDQRVCVRGGTMDATSASMHDDRRDGRTLA